MGRSAEGWRQLMQQAVVAPVVGLAEHMLS